MSAKELLPIYLFTWELESMPNYSASNPTGTTIGKFWRRRLFDDDGLVSGWLVGTYTHKDARWAYAAFFQVVLRQGPKPRSYYPPDWHNSKHYERGER